MLQRYRAQWRQGAGKMGQDIQQEDAPQGEAGARIQLNAAQALSASALSSA